MVAHDVDPSTDPATALFAKLNNPATEPLIQELRALVKAALPTTTEKVHLGWSAIHYQVGATMKGVVVGLSPQRSYVNLEFIDGVDLPDPAGKLEGTGKRLRHVKIRTSADVHDPTVHTLLAEAAKLRGLSRA